MAKFRKFCGVFGLNFDDFGDILNFRFIGNVLEASSAVKWSKSVFWGANQAFALSCTP